MPAGFSAAHARSLAWRRTGPSSREDPASSRWTCRFREGSRIVEHADPEREDVLHNRGDHDPDREANENAGGEPGQKLRVFLQEPTRGLGRVLAGPHHIAHEATDCLGDRVRHRHEPRRRLRLRRAPALALGHSLALGHGTRKRCAPAASPQDAEVGFAEVRVDAMDRRVDEQLLRLAPAGERIDERQAQERRRQGQTAHREAQRAQLILVPEEVEIAADQASRIRGLDLADSEAVRDRHQ
jgi:hypothetical protein